MRSLQVMIAAYLDDGTCSHSGALGKPPLVLLHKRSAAGVMQQMTLKNHKMLKKESETEDMSHESGSSWLEFKRRKRTQKRSKCRETYRPKRAAPYSKSPPNGTLSKGTEPNSQRGWS